MRIFDFFRSSIRNKLAVVMLLLSIGGIGTVALITRSTLLTQLNDFSARISQTSDTMRADVVGRNLSSAAADIVTDIDTFLLERIQDVRRISEEPAVIQVARAGTLQAASLGLSGRAMANDDIAAALNNGLFLPVDSSAFTSALSYAFKQTELPQTPFVEIIVTEASGINVIITRPVNRVSHADDGWWQDAAEFSQAGVGIIQPFIDEGSGLPCLAIALPVIDDETRRIIGVVRAVVNLTALQQRLSEKAVRLDVDIQVLTGEGLLVAETQSGHDLQRLLNPQMTDEVRAFAPATLAHDAQRGISGAGFTVTAAGEPPANLIVGYAHTSGSDFYDVPAQLSGFRGAGWGVTVAQPEESALQVISSLIETSLAFARLPDQLIQSFTVLTLIVAAVGVAGAIVLSGSIIRPLLQLNQMSRQVQDGDLDTSLKVTTRDEIGELGHAFNAMVEGLRQRERERDIFGRVVSPEVREKLLTGQLQLGGETRWVSVVFSDIREFSTISEKMPPQDLVAFLNEYLSEMTEAIKPYGGYINNFIGDAIVAIFGAPIDQEQKEWRAVGAALEMRRRLDDLNERRAARGETPIRSGIGISTGEAVAGQIGSLDRLLYTVIGDAVNVAARLEALTKDYPEHAILVNQQTAEAIMDRSDVVLSPLGPIHVKGRTEPVTVYAVVGKHHA